MAIDACAKLYENYECRGTLESLRS